MKLISIEMENFKGVKNVKHTFDGKSAIVSGINGTGKTTIADAFFWIFVDRDYSLRNKPEIFNIYNKEENRPKVTIMVEVDGVEHTLSKWQIRKTKDKNGQIEVSTNNEYSINECPKSATEFKKFFVEHEIDIDKFLECAHADVFCGYSASKKDRDNMRTTLFSAVKSYSDAEISEMCGTTELFELLGKYKIEEITAMNARNIKAADEQLKSIPEQIVGMEKTKCDYDGSALELEKNQLNEEIEKLENRKKEGSNREEIAKLEQDIFKIDFDINDCVRKANEQIITNRRKSEDELSDVQRNIRNKEYAINQHENIIVGLKKEVENLNSENKKTGEEYHRIEAEVMDEKSKYCPNCGQILPDDKIGDIIADFENKKQERMKSLVEKGKNQKNEIYLKNNVIDKTNEELSAFREEYKKLLDEETRLKDVLSELPIEANMYEDDEWTSLNRQKDDMQKKIEELKSSKVDLLGIEQQIFEKSELLKEAERKIALVAYNSVIDEKIEELREQQIDATQSKANAKKILDQIATISKKKNELLSDAVNGNFKMVKFQLFDYQKNGEYIEVCNPTVDGKKLGESANTGLELLAKMDIVSGLQKIHGMELPIIIDKVECLDNENLKNLMSSYPDKQIIALKVDDCELKVEVL